MLQRPIESSLSRYGLAAVAVAAAVVLRVVLIEIGIAASTTTYTPYYAAIVLSALYGGWGAGFASLLLSTVASAVLWQPRAAVLSTPAALSLGLFVMVGGLVVWLTHLTRLARVRAERAEHRVQTVLNSITDGFVAVDFDWRYTYVNEAAEAYFGISEGALIGRNCWDVFPQALGTPLEYHYRRVMDGREPVTVELPAILAPNSWAHLRISPSAEGMSVTFRDVTEERHMREASARHRERFHRALASARMAAWEYVAADDRIIYSAAAADVLGVPADALPTDAVRGRLLIHPDDWDQHRTTVAEALHSADGQYQSRFRLAPEFLFGRPGPVWLEDCARMLFDEVGRLTVIQGVLQDVTAQQSSEDRIHRLNEELRDRVAERQLLLDATEASRAAAERSSRAKDEFLAVLSHELRSPMQSVLGWVQVLRSAPLDADAAARALDTIERNLRQQTQLINDMLDVSRIVTGKLVFHLTTLPLVSVVRETIDELRPQAEAKTVRVDVTTTGDLFVVADRERVRQVVSNLFTNAVKFTPPGGAVSITCREHQGSARLEVRDTGLGIAADQLPRIFERFRQADTSLTREHEGLGLGLSITRYIVNHLGGSIEADSDGPGRGSCFSVQFPLAAGVHAAAVPVAASSRPASSRRLAGLDLLVVDDHLDTVELVAFVLRRQGALVRTAASAPEALAAIAAHPAQVLVTDLSMPGMDGFALLAQVRALPDGAAVQAIALSGLARPDDRRRALAAGFSAHLAKPIEPATLVDAVERLTADPALGQAAPS